VSATKTPGLIVHPRMDYPNTTGDDDDDEEDDDDYDIENPFGLD